MKEEGKKMDNIIMAAVIAGVILLFAAVLVVKRLQIRDSPLRTWRGMNLNISAQSF